VSLHDQLKFSLLLIHLRPVSVIKSDYFWQLAAGIFNRFRSVEVPPIAPEEQTQNGAGWITGRVHKNI
jgi:hypothetical protein